MSTHEVENIPERIREEIKRIGISLSEASRQAGEKSPQRLKDVLAGRQRCPVDLLYGLRTAGVDISYVMYGERTSESPKIWYVPEPGTPGDGYIPLYDVEGAAGAGRSLEHEKKIGSFNLDTGTFSELGFGDVRLAGIRVRGDSMEPTLTDNDWVIVNLDEHSYMRGGVFLIWVSGELRIKRLQRVAGGAVLLISDNKLYEREMIAPDNMQDFSVLGRVVLRLGEIS